MDKYGSSAGAAADAMPGWLRRIRDRLADSAAPRPARLFLAKVPASSSDRPVKPCCGYVPAAALLLAVLGELMHTRSCQWDV